MSKQYQNNVIHSYYGQGQADHKGFNANVEPHQLLLLSIPDAEYTPKRAAYFGVGVPQPHLDNYDGTPFKIIKKAMREQRWPATLDLLFVSYTYGVTPFTHTAKVLDYASAVAKVQEPTIYWENTVAGQLQAVLEQRWYDQVFLMVHNPYHLWGLEVAPLLEASNRKLSIPSGSIGQQYQQMKEWLDCLSPKVVLFKPKEVAKPRAATTILQKALRSIEGNEKPSVPDNISYLDRKKFLPTENKSTEPKEEVVWEQLSFLPTENTESSTDENSRI